MISTIAYAIAGFHGQWRDDGLVRRRLQVVGASEADPRESRDDLEARRPRVAAHRATDRDLRYRT
ncbi:hypothetical protein [Micromonospora chersina]|uniref:hypothetical protein n=1 Tax=Micromonospora chersina TaxID=47854 RepID=UPI00111301B3|nr:hypothetical protein [Micromonospora chersina]